MDPSNVTSELDSFREQWRAEVRAKRPGHQSDAQQPVPTASGSSQRAGRIPEPPRKSLEGKQPLQEDDEEDDHVEAPSLDAPEPEPAASSSSATAVEPGEPESKEPVTALDHYEKAVEREIVGNLGDSLRLYRKAFKMDERVDQKYKHKHFPAAAVSKMTQATSSNAEVTAPNTANDSTDSRPLPMKELIESFASFSIEGKAPEIEGTPQPPCPIADLPDELLVHILRDVAVVDVGDFVRLARVCKRLAYLVVTENQIWRRICLGSETGFGGMHYHWQKGVSWGPLDPDDVDEPEDRLLTPSELEARRREEGAANSLAFLNALYSSSWQRMFRLRPRIRFNGCYISTVNYIRSGQASAHQTTWNTPVHIVTYYRYLRFFRDGTVISLVTTAEPVDVVGHMTREAVALHAGSAMAHLPSAVMQSGLKGRWRLSTEADKPDVSVSEVEGDLIVETEGVSKYIYRLDLSLRSAGRGAKNTKLVWRGFYSYHTLTDDWAEFQRRNEKPFFFSRVKSYGSGA